MIALPVKTSLGTSGKGIDFKRIQRPLYPKAASRSCPRDHYGINSKHRRMKRADSSQGEKDDLTTDNPCHPRACAIQGTSIGLLKNLSITAYIDCLQKNNYNEEKCRSQVRRHAIDTTPSIKLPDTTRLMPFTNAVTSSTRREGTVRALRAVPRHLCCGERPASFPSSPGTYLLTVLQPEDEAKSAGPVGSR
jgi:hypothetical protein